MSERRNQVEAAEFQSRGDDPASELGEVVLVGLADLLDQTMGAKALD